MKRRIVVVLLGGWAATAGAQMRLDADLSCVETRHDLVYDCRIALRERESGKPVSGADFSIGADMPSMPMAHNVKPVRAAPGTAPGEYAARLELEMYGEWAVKLDVRKPARDRIVKKMMFAAPARQ